MVLWRVLALGPVVLPAEGDAALVDGEQAAGWRSPPGGCSATDRRAPPPARRRGAWHRRPIRTARSGASQAANARASASAAYSPKNCSRPARCAWLEFFEEAAAEQPREHPHRQEEARLAGDPALAVGRRARRPGRCRAHADGASAPSPRCAGPGSRRSARRDAWGRRRWCAASRRRPSNSRS